MRPLSNLSCEGQARSISRSCDTQPVSLLYLQNLCVCIYIYICVCVCVYINFFIFSQTITPLTIDSLMKATQIILLRSDAHQTQQHWIRGPPLQWHNCRRHHLNSLLSTIIFPKFGYFLFCLFLFLCSTSSLCQQIYFHILLILSNFPSHRVALGDKLIYKLPF